MGRNILLVIISVITGIIGYHLLAPTPEPITYTRVVVDTIRGEPVVETRFIDRIVYREREPETIIEQPGGAEDVVEDFCKPDTIIQVLEGDTTYLPADTVYLVRSVVHSPGWLLGRDKVTFYGPLSTGSLQEVRFNSYPGWTFRSDPELTFREPRFGLLRQLAEAGVWIGLGYLGGKIF